MTLLGTGGSAGVPQIGGADGQGDWGDCDPAEPRNRRTRASIVIEQAGRRVLVDTSPDMRAQFLTCAVPRVDAIVFTHAHADHILGLDEVRILNRIADAPIEVFATAETLAELARRFDYAFKPWTPPHFFRPVLLPRLVEAGETFTPAGVEMTGFMQSHGYIQTLGLRVGGFGYSTDVVELDAAALAALEGVETWVVDCFQRRPHPSHAWLARVREWAARLRPARTVLTHMGNDLDYATLARSLPPGTEPGYDGMVLEIG